MTEGNTPFTVVSFWSGNLVRICNLDVPLAGREEETVKTFCAEKALKGVSLISVLVVPEQTPVAVFQLPPVQDKTVTVRALFVAGAIPSVMRVDVPVAAIDKPRD